MVLLRSLSSVSPTFLATARYRASSICFVRTDSFPVHLLFSQELFAVTIDKGAKYKEQELLRCFSFSVVTF